MKQQPAQQWRRRQKTSDSAKSRAQDTVLSRFNANAAGIDVGASSHWVAVPADRDEQAVRCFGTFTADLYAIAQWLEQCAIQTVVMESTGIYWIPLFEVLETRGFDVKLIDAHHVKQVPGRKTDVQDCRWLQELHSYGLLRGAFRPEDEVCILRSYLRQREGLIGDASRAIQHMQKALEQMNVKLTEVVSDITGKTGMTIIRLILAGERDAETLAKHRDPRCKQDQATLRKALQGTWRQEHVFALEQAVARYDFFHEQICACDQQIEACLKTFETKAEIEEASQRPRRRQGNTPDFDVWTLLYQMTGVDLTQIDGIDVLGALKVISEIGLDMTRWPTVKHFTSWLGLCPGNKISGGKRYRSRTKPTANRAAAAFRLAAQTLSHSHSALGAYYRRMRARLGAPGAITATAHKLARIVYSMLRHGVPYVDVGQHAYEQQYRDRAVKNLKRNARAFGFALVPMEGINPEQATATP
jgi:transposase